MTCQHQAGSASGAESTREISPPRPDPAAACHSCMTRQLLPTKHHRPLENQLVTIQAGCQQHASGDLLLRSPLSMTGLEDSNAQPADSRIEALRASSPGAAPCSESQPPSSQADCGGPIINTPAADDELLHAAAASEASCLSTSAMRTCTLGCAIISI